MFAKIVRQKAIENNLKYMDIAKKCGWTGSQLSSKLRRDKMKESEMLKIAQALDCDLEIRLVTKPETENTTGEQRL